MHRVYTETPEQRGLGNEGPPAQGQAPSHYGSSEQAQKEDFSFFLAMLGVHEGGVDTVS